MSPVGQARKIIRGNATLGAPYQPRPLAVISRWGAVIGSGAPAARVWMTASRAPWLRSSAVTAWARRLARSAWWAASPWRSALGAITTGTLGLQLSQWAAAAR